MAGGQGTSAWDPPTSTTPAPPHDPPRAGDAAAEAAAALAARQAEGIDAIAAELFVSPEIVRQVGHRAVVSRGFRPRACLAWKFKRQACVGIGVCREGEGGCCEVASTFHVHGLRIGANPHAG